MDYSELLRHVDHTLLTPTATWDQVKTVCSHTSDPHRHLGPGQDGL